MFRGANPNENFYQFHKWWNWDYNLEGKDDMF